MKKIISVLMAVVLLSTMLCGCNVNKGNAGSTKTQANSFSQEQLLGTWTLRFTYNAFFKNMATMKDAPLWVTLMANVSTKARFEMTFTFSEDGTCTSVADAEDVTIATEQFMADVQSYFHDGGVYDLLYKENGWGKAMVDKKLQEQGKTVAEYADETVENLLPAMESLFAEMAVETTVDYTLEGTILTLLSGGETVSRLFCRYNDESEVVFKQDSPDDICFYAGMGMTKAE